MGCYRKRKPHDSKNQEESQFCTHFCNISWEKLFWKACIQCGLVCCWSVCLWQVSMSRQLDDTYCEIVFFILISLGHFSRLHFESKAGVRPERRRARGGWRAAKGPRVGFEARAWNTNSPTIKQTTELFNIFGLIRPTLIDSMSMRLSFLIYQAIIQYSRMIFQKMCKIYIDITRFCP